jgi:hypothetical protein
MSVRWYRLGLLFVVFGGFLASNSSGSFAGIGMWAMFIGLGIGIVGVVSPAGSNG